MPRLVFEKYEIIRRLAIGGMGEIFLARQGGQAGFDRLVILKSLLPEFVNQTKNVDRFLDEARVAAALNHPNIVNIYEVGQWEGSYFIAMEYIDGGSLADVAALAFADPTMPLLPPPIAAVIIRDAAAALDFAHKANDVEGKPLGIVHRDISPQNIMIRRDGVSKVVDFGIAKASNRLTRTATGQIVGKLQYLSPEQARSEALDGRSDQFSLGVVFWELLAGQRLFKADDILSVYRMITQAQIPRPSELRPECPVELEQIALRMLRPDPAERFSTCGEVVNELRAFLGGFSHEYSETQVAALVESLLGEQIRQRVSELTPNEALVLEIISSKHHRPLTSAEMATIAAPDERSAELAEAALAAPRRRRWPLALAAAILLGAAGAYPATRLMRRLDPPPISSAAADPVQLETLVLSIPSPSSTPASKLARRGAIKISTPLGAWVMIDGSTWGERVPTTITGLAPGPHELHLVLPGQTPMQRRVVVPPDPEPAGDDAPPAVAGEPAMITVTSRPPGATVFAGPRSLGVTPCKIDSLQAGPEHVLTVEKRGFKAETITLQLKPGHNPPRKVELEKLRPGARPPPREPQVIERVVERFVDRPVASGQVGSGSLSVTTTPWTMVEIDGRPYGTTPLFKVRLPAGKHELRLVNKVAGIDQRRTVVIKADDHTKLNLQLGE